MTSQNGKSFWSGFGRVLKSADMFGVPVTLNYNGTPTFKTAIGGLVSFLVYITFGIIAAVLNAKQN